MTESTCIGFNIPCDVLLKGTGVVLTAFVLFVGSVYLLLSAVFGRWMGYLVLAVSLTGWMMLFSALWFFGFWSQGPDTPTNQGPRGQEPAWVVLEAATDARSGEFPEIEEYPGGSWRTPGLELAASSQSVTSAVQDFLSEQANEETGKHELEPGAFAPTDFTVQDVAFAVASDGKTSLAASHAFYNRGGPTITLLLKHDSGTVWRYSLMFLVGSVVLFLAHLPLLDRAETRRKEILTGGAAPPWYGPA